LNIVEVEWTQIHLVLKQ